MYHFKDKKITEKDLYTYREKYIKFNIFFDTSMTIIALLLGIFLVLEGETKYNRTLIVIIVVLVECLMIYATIKTTLTNLRELKKDNISFSEREGIFKYVNKGTRKHKDIHYYVDNFEIHTHFTSSKMRRYSGKKVKVYFYINDKNIKEAFLLNEINPYISYY